MNRKLSYVSFIMVFVAMIFCAADFNEVFARGGGGGGGGGRGGGFSSGSSGRSSGSSWGGSSSRSSSSSSSWGSKSSSTPSKPSTPSSPSTPSTPSSSDASKSTSSWGSKSNSVAQAPSAAKDTTSGAKTSWGSARTEPAKVNVQSARAAAYANKNLVADKARVASVQNSVKSTTPTDWGAARSSYSAGKQPYTPTVTAVNRSHEERTVIINKYHNYGPSGMYYADPFNHSMMFMFSTIWWMNMWDHVDRSHYRDDPRMRELEREVAQLRAQQGANWKPDPNYKDPGMTDAVMYSDGYLQAVKDGKITPKELDKTAKEASDKEDSLAWIIFISAAFILLVVIGMVAITIKQRKLHSR